MKLPCGPWVVRLSFFINSHPHAFQHNSHSRHFPILILALTLHPIGCRLYQYTWFGTDTMAASTAGWGGSTGFGANLVDPALGIVFTDMLQLPWARREPTVSGTGLAPSPSPNAGDWRRSSEWARALRFSEFTSECSLASTLEGADREYATGGPTGGKANRRCRFTWSGLRWLLANRAGGESDLSVHVEVTHDVCEGAATGARAPVSPTLTRTQAAYGLPSFSVFLEGSAGPLMQFPRTCSVVADCVVPGIGFTPECVDIDTRLLSLSNLFQNKDVNPFAEFALGSYNTGQTCGTNDDLRGAVRSFVRGLAGQRQDTNTLSGGTAPRFCMYNPQRLADWYTSRDDQRFAFFDTAGACANANYTSPGRLCLASRLEPQPTSIPGYPAALQGGSVRLNAVAGLAVGNLAPRPGAGGVERFVPNSRSGTTPGFLTNTFTISIPGIRLEAFTNNWRERLRWALSQALVQFGIPIPPEGILITAVRNNADAFTPLPGGSRAGVTVQFTVESPTVEVQSNVTAQLRTGGPGTLSAAAGPTLAALGLVPLLSQREIVFREVSPVFPATGLDGGTLFGILILVGLIGIGASYLLHLFVLKPRGIRVPLVPSPSAIGGCFGCLFGLLRGKRGVASSSSSQKKKAAGDDDEESGKTPVKKVANPLNAAVAAPAAAVKAPAPSTAAAPAAAAAAPLLVEAPAAAAAGGVGAVSEPPSVPESSASSGSALFGGLDVVPNPLAAAAAAAAAAPGEASAAAASESAAESVSAAVVPDGAVAPNPFAALAASLPVSAPPPVTPNAFSGGEYPSLPDVAPVPQPPPPPPTASAPVSARGGGGSAPASAASVSALAAKVAAEAASSAAGGAPLSGSVSGSGTISDFAAGEGGPSA